MKKRDVTGLALSAALGASLLLAPGTIAYAEQAPVEGCEVTGGTLTWGVLERWRVYVSGPIANGSYEAVDGAAYEIPNFVWSGATGAIDPATGAGSVSFGGGAHFTGHSGALDTTFSNPTIEFAEGGTATLLLDVHSLGRDGDPEVNETQVAMADLGTVPAVDPESGSYELGDAPATLTEFGSGVFTAYPAGQPMDPIALSLQFGDCAAAAAEAEPEAETEEEAQPLIAEEEGSEVPWLPIGIGAAVVVAAAAAGIFAVRRKKQQSQDAAESGDEQL